MVTVFTKKELKEEILYHLKTYKQSCEIEASAQRLMAKSALECGKMDHHKALSIMEDQNMKRISELDALINEIPKL